jgi:hypothetical protein
VAEKYAAVDESTTLPLAGPTARCDAPLTDILRRGARTLLARAIDSEVAAYLQERAHLKDGAGRQQVVRNGYLPERTVLTGVGPVEVKQPRMRDRRPAEQREAFTSAILPPYLRKTRSLEDLIPWLYLKGVSTGDFTDALKALLGPDAPGLSATTVTRLKAGWEAEYDAWSQRSLEGKHYVYVWADGVHFNIRLEEDRQCILVLMGATAEGTKELIAVADGYRESEQSWKELLPEGRNPGREVRRRDRGEGRRLNQLPSTTFDNSSHPRPESSDVLGASAPRFPVDDRPGCRRRGGRGEAPALLRAGLRLVAAARGRRGGPADAAVVRRGAQADRAVAAGVGRRVRLPVDGEGVPQAARGLRAPVDVRGGGGGAAAQQRGGAGTSARGDLAPDEPRHGRRAGQPVRGAAADRGGDVPPASAPASRAPPHRRCWPDRPATGVPTGYGRERLPPLFLHEVLGSEFTRGRRRGCGGLGWEVHAPAGQGPSDVGCKRQGGRKSDHA